jgi:WD40 repeat protein
MIRDIRKNELVKTLDQVHSDDITQIQFHPKHSNYLISSSMDGIINLYDLNQMNEDDIIISTTNTESSIHRIGFFGPLFEYIYCLSHMETLTLWKAENVSSTKMHLK